MNFLNELHKKLKEKKKRLIIDQTEKAMSLPSTFPFI